MRFHDVIGYGESVESPAGSGTWKDQITEVLYTGDVKQNSRRLEDGESLNSDISVQNLISIVADQFANEHFFAIRYIRWAGTLWTVTKVDVQRPRLVLTLGSVYNGPTFIAPESP